MDKRLLSATRALCEGTILLATCCRRTEAAAFGITETMHESPRRVLASLEVKILKLARTCRRDNSNNQNALPTLKPVVRWDRDLEQWTDLVPQTAQQLYFGSDDPMERYQFADLTANFTGRAVVLQHSGFVTTVKCNPSSIEVNLANDAAHSMVKTE
ncbi:hypothetical protein CERZMDRAFT_83489 [Cercospora zeae-maydis SCOH1-5]|uniref:Uncharacterized protein n=1 Tax=Cercospora zeae-maydis SCOH1-5 TaxID=717836 RepID=A0A6A6FLD2_9PEZI|nr:hypothetical protein CERZMDRAFT_83489 [Cercospora zeae-maydis SCOH1-5]